MSILEKANNCSFIAKINTIQIIFAGVGGFGLNFHSFPLKFSSHLKLKRYCFCLLHPLTYSVYRLFIWQCLLRFLIMLSLYCFDHSNNPFFECQFFSFSSYGGLFNEIPGVTAFIRFMSALVSVQQTKALWTYPSYPLAARCICLKWNVMGRI